MIQNKWTALARLQETEGNDDHRTRPRFVARELGCEHGRVEDFSASGVRICYTRSPRLCPGDMIDLELFSPMGRHCCSTEVMWSEKKGFRRYEVGFRFEDPEAAKQMQLFQLGFDPSAGSNWTKKD